MTDERFTFIADIKEKNSTKSGAYHRINGSKSKRCTLPSDRLTPAQLKRRNSPVESIKLNKPCTYAELKTVTPSLQFLYLDHLVHEYKARRVDLLTMLCISNTCLTKLQKRLPGKLIFQGKARQPSPEWQAFITGFAPEVEATAPIPEPEPEPQAADPGPVTLGPELLAGSVTLVATLPELQEVLAQWVNTSRPYKFTVSFE